MKSGFYRLNGTLQYAENFVYSSNFELKRELKDSYTYPIFEWYWFDSEQEACEFFGLPFESVNIDTE